VRKAHDPGEAENPMRRAPVLVLICGVLATLFGGVSLVASDRIEGLAWLAAPITALGLVLVGFWLRSAARRPGPEDSPRLPAAPLPGRWYPYAVVGIGVLLLCWVYYWTKFR
jgi:hypothetical protein